MSVSRKGLAKLFHLLLPDVIRVGLQERTSDPVEQPQFHPDQEAELMNVTAARVLSRSNRCRMLR
jgi:hypothetical protein